jgi:hypothetical protein
MRLLHVILALDRPVPAAVTSPSEPQPTEAAAQPARTPTVIARQRTGHDLRVMAIGTTGAPKCLPIFIFWNVGEEPTIKTVRFRHRFQGALVSWYDIPGSHRGQTIVIHAGDAEGGFGRYGHDIEGFAACDNAVRTDNEANDHLKQVLSPLFMQPAPSRP